MSTQQGSYNTYIGARYVPIFDGQWNNTKAYEPLVIVENQGNSYTSKTYVPIGVDINNTVYWALTGNYNAQVEAYRQEVVRYQEIVETFDSRISENEITANYAKKYVDNLYINVVNPPNTLIPADNTGTNDCTESLKAIIAYAKSTNAKSKLIYFPKGVYKFSDTLQIDFSGLTIKGESRGASILEFTNDTNIYALNIDSKNRLSYITISDLTLYYNGENNNAECLGIYANNTSFITLTNMHIANFYQHLVMGKTTNSYIYNIVITCNLQKDVVGVACSGTQASSYYEQIMIDFAQAKTGTGMAFQEKSVQDIYLRHCEFASMTYAILIEGANADYATNINLDDIVADNISATVFLLRNITGQSTFNFTNGWFNNKGTNDTTVFLINNCENMNFNNIQFNTIINSYQYVTMFNIDSCKNITINNCILLNPKNGIIVNNSRGCVIINNKFINTFTNDKKSNTFLQLVSCSDCNILNNVMRGYGNFGIAIGETNTKCIIAANNVDSTITTPITVTATNSFVGANLPS